MGGGDAAAARRRRVAADPLRSHVMDCCADPHHINQGVNGAHLMEMHRLGGLAMDRGLRFGQSREHRQHRLQELGLKGGVLQAVADLRPVAMRWVRLQPDNTEATPPQATAAGLLHVQAHQIFQPKLRQGSLDHLKRNPKVEKSRQQHVAGQSGRTVDVQRSSGRLQRHRPSRGAELNNWSALWLRSA